MPLFGLAIVASAIWLLAFTLNANRYPKEPVLSHSTWQVTAYDTIGLSLWRAFVSALFLGLALFMIYVWLFPPDLTKVEWHQCEKRKERGWHLQFPDSEISNKLTFQFSRECDDEVRKRQVLY